MMRVFQVRQGQSAAILWTGEALNEVQALDSMAHAAGYRDAATLPETVRAHGLAVEELRFGAAARSESALRSAGGRMGRVFRSGSNGECNEQAVG